MDFLSTSVKPLTPRRPVFSAAVVVVCSAGHRPPPCFSGTRSAYRSTKSDALFQRHLFGNASQERTNAIRMNRPSSRMIPFYVIVFLRYWVSRYWLGLLDLRWLDCCYKRDEWWCQSVTFLSNLSSLLGSFVKVTSRMWHTLTQTSPWGMF